MLVLSHSGVCSLREAVARVNGHLDLLRSGRGLLSACLTFRPGVGGPGRREGEVLADPLAVDVLKLCAILLVQSHLTFEQERREDHNLRHVWQFETLLKHTEPKSVDLADLPNLLPALSSFQAKVFLFQLKLKLKAKENHAGGQDARLVL